MYSTQKPACVVGESVRIFFEFKNVVVVVSIFVSLFIIIIWDDRDNNNNISKGSQEHKRKKCTSSISTKYYYQYFVSSTTSTSTSNINIMKLFVTPTSSSTTTTLALMVMVMMMISAPFSHVQAQEAEQEAQQPELFSTDHIVTLPLMADMEVPPIENSTALGGIALVYNEASDAILWAMDIFNPEMWELTAAHIHCGNVGENGPVLVPLLTDLADSSTEMGFAGAISQNNILPPQEGDDCSSSYENVLDIWVALAAGLGLYVNVHSTETPSGELRGDAAAAIQPIPDSIIALDLSGEYEVPPNDNSTAFGTSTFVYSSATDSIGWVMDISNPDQLQIFGDIGAHIHCGGAGTNGGVIVTLVPPGITDDSPMIGQAGLITSNNFVPGLCFDNIPELWLAMKTGSIVCKYHHHQYITTSWLYHVFVRSFAHSFAD